MPPSLHRSPLLRGGPRLEIQAQPCTFHDPGDRARRIHHRAFAFDQPLAPAYSTGKVAGEAKLPHAAVANIPTLIKPTSHFFMNLLLGKTRGPR